MRRHWRNGEWKGLVVIVNSLDHNRAVDSERFQQVRRALVNLFDKDYNNLRLADCRTVFTLPMYVPISAAELPADRVHLPRIHVPATPGTGPPRRHIPGVPARDQQASPEEISTQLRRWRLHRWIYHTFGEVARTINPIVAGWMQYYGTFYPSALYPLLARINAYLVRWIRNKYRRYHATRPARRKLREITLGYPRLFRHWRWVTTAW